MRGWWTTELYFEGVTTRHDGSAFGGWRWENRFRPLVGEHRINPVLYVEYENVNEASRIQKGIVGSGSLSQEPIAELRREHAHELEGKLILSSTVRGWNLAENFIFEKNLSEDEGVEFGYSVGVSRALGGLATATTCHVCKENFVLGVEAYGGLGSTKEATLTDTRHFLAPVVAWQVTSRSTLKASVGFGLSDASDWYLLRLGWDYELPDWEDAMIGIVPRGTLVRRIAIMIGLIGLACASGRAAQDQPNPKWAAPPAAVERINPLAHAPDAEPGGRKVFHQRCATCHGPDGEGTNKAPSLTARRVQAQTDGALFWKITQGNTHGGMPTFSFLPEPQRWQLVLHLRTIGPRAR